MPNWAEFAIRKRMSGWTLQRIADSLGVSRQRVFVVCRGIECPVDNRSVAASKTQKEIWSNPEKRAERISAIKRGLERSQVQLNLKRE